MHTSGRLFRTASCHTAILLNLLCYSQARMHGVSWVRTNPFPGSTVHKINKLTIFGSQGPIADHKYYFLKLYCSVLAVSVNIYLSCPPFCYDFISQKISFSHFSPKWTPPFQYPAYELDLIFELPILPNEKAIVLQPICPTFVPSTREHTFVALTVTYRKRSNLLQ